MFPFIPLLIGAAGGALMNKKDPLKGALMGAGLGAGAGLLAPAALGAATPGFGGAAAGSQAGMLAAQEAGLGATSLGWGGATTGVQGALNGVLGAETGASMGGLLGQGMQVAKPVGTAMNVASAMKPQDQPPPMPAMPSAPPVQSPAFSQVVQNRNNMQAQRMAMENQRKNRRYGLINNMG